MVIIDDIISTIVGLQVFDFKSQLERHEAVTKLLKKFNLDPDRPPADFRGVYHYALVEYGIGKPKQFLELFQQNRIQEAFRYAFENNNPAIAIAQGEDFLNEYDLGQEIRELGIEPKREFAAFVAVFIEIAKYTRTPIEVRRDYKLENVQQRVADLQERLDRLSTLEGIHTEITRIAAQNESTLPAAELPKKPKCQAFGLAQQMRGWFETLNYRFEKYEVWQDNYFEWIIDIPARRGYERILVRGLEGEAQISDLAALRQSVNEQRTDEGWLVSTRQVNRSAFYTVERQANCNLFCYTFDGLLDEAADFSSYFDWLEAEVKRRGIDQMYRPLACTKEEFDPLTQQWSPSSRYDEHDGSIDGYIDCWLDDPTKKHLSVLGDLGAGKTWFAFHYAWTTLQRYRQAKKRGIERPRLPLVIPLQDYAQAGSVESLLSEFFFRKHEIALPGYSAFEQLNQMGKLLLIFDGLEEMAPQADHQKMMHNFWELVKVAIPRAKVILTCRTEYFPDVRAEQALWNTQLQASSTNLTAEAAQFEVLQLETFKNDQKSGVPLKLEIGDRG